MLNDSFTQGCQLHRVPYRSQLCATQSVNAQSFVCYTKIIY